MTPEARKLLLEELQRERNPPLFALENEAAKYPGKDHVYLHPRDGKTQPRRKVTKDRPKGSSTS